MSTLTCSAPAVKAKKLRLARVLSRSGNVRIVEIDDGKKITRYAVEKLSAQFGRGYVWQKSAAHGGETYSLNLGDEVSGPSCECLGFLRYGHKKPCRHIACTRALIQENRLD